MPRPTTKVEIAFNAGYGGSPTWTDITARGHVKEATGIEISHWRGDEDSETRPSTCGLTLRNDDGRYTPGNADGTHYPNVIKGRQIRVTSTLNGETFDRFTGFIDDWRVDWPGKVGWIADCGVTASSRLARLARGAELRSMFEEEVLADSPAAFYLLNEPEGAISAADTSGNAVAPLLVAGAGTAVVFGAPGPGLDGLTAAQFTSGKFLTSASITLGASASVECWFTTTSDGLLFALGTSFQVSQSAGTIHALSGLPPSGASISAGSGMDDGEPHHLAVTATNAGTLSLYIDGELVGTDTIAGLGSGELTVGQCTGTVSAVARYNYVLSAARIAVHAAGFTGFAGEMAGERIARYADYAGIGASALDLDDGQVQDLAHVNTTGMTALAAMRQVESTEGGVLFDALDGTLTFHDRAHRYEAAAAGSDVPGEGPPGFGPHGTAFTLSYTQGHIANPLAPVLDDQQQVNDMSSTNAQGVVARQSDTASITNHGLYRESLDLATDDPDEPLMRASWVVNRYADPTTRVSSVEVLLNKLDDQLTACVLEAEVGTIFTLSDLPGQAPAEVMHLFVEGRNDKISGSEDRVIFRTSPAELFEVFSLDDPVRGVLGSDYPLGY